MGNDFSHKNITISNLFFFGYNKVLSQDLKTVFLDSVIINDYLSERADCDTTISNIRYTIKIKIDFEITVYGNLDHKESLSGMYRFTFRSDDTEFVKGEYKKGRRIGNWVISCGAAKTYKRGKRSYVRTCPM